MSTTDEPLATERLEAADYLLDNAYILGHHGFLYTSNRLPTSTTVRHPGVLLISVNRKPFRIRSRKAAWMDVAAALVPPRVERTLDSHGVPMLSMNISPGHPTYHVFQAMQKSGVMRLDRDAFNHLNDDFERLLYGKANIVEAELTFARAVSDVHRFLPPASAPDPRALSFIQMLDANPELSLNGLAKRMGYSQQVMSRLFTSAVGMSLRDYQNWLRQRRVHDTLYTKRSLTRVAYRSGFTDPPQLTRSFQRWYGDTPTHFRDPKHVRVFTHGGSNQSPLPSTDPAAG